MRTELPTITWKGKQYHLDEHLEEMRSVDDPKNRIELKRFRVFGSETVYLSTYLLACDEDHAREIARTLGPSDWNDYDSERYIADIEEL